MDHPNMFDENVLFGNSPSHLFKKSKYLIMTHFIEKKKPNTQKKNE